MSSLLSGQHGAVIQFFAKNSSAQDKVFRAIYYFGMYVKWQAQQNGHTKDTLATISRVASSAGRWRKMQRMLKSPNLWRNVIIMALKFNFSNPTLIEVAKLISKVAGTLYITFDHLKYLFRIGLWHPKSKEQREWAFWFGSLSWLLDISFDTLWRVMRLGQVAGKRETGERKQKVNKEQNAHYRRVIKNMFDLPCVLYSLKWCGVETWSPGLIGIFGTIVSLMPLYEIWPQANDNKKQLRPKEGKQIRTERYTGAVVHPRVERYTNG